MIQTIGVDELQMAGLRSARY